MPHEPAPPNPHHDNARARAPELEDFGRKPLFEFFLHATPPHSTWRICQLAFTLAAFSHLWLEDAWHQDWLPGNILLLLGALLILIMRGPLLGFLLASLGTLQPLLFARDQLTQSVILLTLSTSAAALLLPGAWRQLKGHIQNHSPPPTDDILATWRAIGASTYALAALHKLNRDYIDASTSCAVYGWDKLARYYRLDPDILPASAQALVPHATLASELGIFGLYAFGQKKLARILAIAFHIPLTLTMAPAFALVMLAMHAAFLDEEELHAIKNLSRKARAILITLAALLTIASLFAHGALPEASMIPKEWLLWALLLLSCHVAWITRSSARFTLPTKPHLLTALTVAIFWLNGLTPYLGIQYQHAAAMLSNLRIDKGCWNSLLFPEAVRAREDYIRIDRAHFNTPGHLPEYETILTEQLWSPPQLRQMQRNWCKDSSRPLYLEGTWREERFIIKDLCALAHDELPFQGAGMLGVELFPDALRFQKNLMRECPQKCIH